MAIISRLPIYDLRTDLVADLQRSDCEPSMIELCSSIDRYQGAELSDMGVRIAMQSFPAQPTQSRAFASIGATLPLRAFAITRNENTIAIGIVCWDDQFLDDAWTLICLQGLHHAVSAHTSDNPFTHHYGPAGFIFRTAEWDELQAPLGGELNNYLNHLVFALAERPRRLTEGRV